jgi:hypothetical protein
MEIRYSPVRRIDGHLFHLLLHFDHDIFHSQLGSSVDIFVIIENILGICGDDDRRPVSIT